MSVRQRISSFDRKNLGALVIIGFVVVMFAGYGATQGAGTPDVSIGQNGIKMNVGTLDVNGNDIVDDGTTLWDSSAGNIDTGVVDYSAATASDVGLGNVENENALAQDGSEVMKGNLEFQNSQNHDIVSGDWKLEDTGSALYLRNDDNLNLESDKDSSSGGPYIWTISGSDGSFDGSAGGDTITFSPDGSDGDYAGSEIRSDTGLYLIGENDQSDEASIHLLDGAAAQSITLDPDKSNNNQCYVNSSGALTCDGSKNWVHGLNNTHEAIYSSQESPEVRAVFEGQAHVVNSKKIDLPSHFSKTVSDTEPELRAQVTPRGTLTDAAAMKVTEDYIEIAVEKETDVDFRVTGIREGYEDKQVVRPKED